MLKQYKGELFLFLATWAAAFGWLFSKSTISSGLPAVAFVSLRFLFAALLFLPFAWGQLRNMNKTQWKNTIMVGFSLVFYLFFWVLGVKYSTELGKGAFILSLAMLVAPLIAWLIYRNRPPMSFAIALPIAVVGMYFLSASGLANGEIGIDVIFFLLAALFAAIQFVLTSRYASQIPPLALTTIQLGMVGIFNGIYALIVEPMPSQINAETWGWLALSVLIGTNLRFLIQTLGQKFSDVGTGAIIMILEPVWTLLLSVIFMAEVLGIQKLLGCGLILGALLVYRLLRKTH